MKKGEARGATLPDEKVFDLARIKSLDGAFIPEDIEKRLGISIDREKGKIVFAPVNIAPDNVVME